MVTCSTPLSRNYRIGEALGKGKSLEEAVEEVGQVAEGVNTVRLVAQKAEEKAVYMPLATGLYKILYEQHSIESIISSLMLGDQALDVEFAAHSEKGFDRGMNMPEQLDDLVENVRELSGWVRVLFVIFLLWCYI